MLFGLLGYFFRPTSFEVDLMNIIVESPKRSQKIPNHSFICDVFFFNVSNFLKIKAGNNFEWFLSQNYCQHNNKNDLFF
jgi:hypothetical protein